MASQHRRHRHDELAELVDSGRYSSLSARPRLPGDRAVYNGGAEIPDIPLRRSSGGRSGLITDVIEARPSRNLDCNDGILIPTPYSGPVNPNKIAFGERRRSLAIMSGVTAPGDRMSPLEPLEPPPWPEDHGSPASRSQSIRSKSTRSGANSSASYQTNATSLPPLQTKGVADYDALEPLAEEEIEPGSFDLVAPSEGTSEPSLEIHSVALFSAQHLRVIFRDRHLLQRFTEFIGSVRPFSLPLLKYYLDSSKALKAIEYSNAVVSALGVLEGRDFASSLASITLNESLQEKASAAFEVMVRDDLPAYITHIWIQVVNLSIQRRITGTLPSHLRDLSEGLAEVFCLTDPSRTDNPIVFASEEFSRTSQYSLSHAIGRNCRFLQGPKTNPFSVRRIREKLDAGQEHYETFLNYRRDGSPFMNLLMVAPLRDSRGTIRYFIGAQVDVSGLVKDCTGLDSFHRLVTEADSGAGGDEAVPEASRKDALQELSEMLSFDELEAVRKHGGKSSRVQHDQQGSAWQRPRILIHDESPIPSPRMATFLSGDSSGRLTGIYQHYLLVRPYPNLRILFASPSLRVPGILQSSFLGKIGGDTIRERLSEAFAGGQGVTAKVRWISRSGAEGRSRWIHCTPLLSSNRAVGVWMVVVVDDETEALAWKARDAPQIPIRLPRGADSQQVQPSQPRRQDGDDDTMSLSSFAAANGLHDELGMLGDGETGRHRFPDEFETGVPYTIKINGE